MHQEDANPATQLVFPGHGGPTAPRDGRDTSLAAGQEVARQFGRRFQRLRARVLAAHLAHPEGLTDAELHGEMPDEFLPSCAKRRHDLVAAGVLVDSGRRRLTPRGRQAIVWRLARPGEVASPSPPAPPERLERRPIEALEDLAPPASGSTVRRALADARARLAVTPEGVTSCPASEA